MAPGLFPALPVFLDLTGRLVVLVDMGAATPEWTARFAAAGAGVRAFGEGANDRPLRGADLRAAALVAVGESCARAHRVRRAARANGAFFVKLGAPDLSDLDLGAAAMRGLVAIGVSVAGAPSDVVRAAQDAIAARLPQRHFAFLESAARMRGKVAAALRNAEAESAFWRAMSARAFENSSSNEDWDETIRAHLNAIS